MSYNEASDLTEGDEDIWHVQLGSGDVCLMTLEQLDDAFQTGVIHENTYLWQEGATGWVTLSKVAGLDSENGSSQPIGSGATSAYVAPASSPMAHPITSPWPAASPASPRFAYDAAQSIFDPPIQNMGPNSTAPVVAPMRDMEFDFEEPVSFKKKRSGGKMLLAAAVVVGAAGFGAVKYGIVQIPQSADPVMAASLASPVPPVATTPPPQQPVVEAPTTPKPSPAKALPDDVKDRLAKADKALAEKQKAKQQQSHAAPRPSRARPSGGGEKVFHKGGETGDPLNSAL